MHWRDEPLTKGEMYDVLHEAAKAVEANVHAMRQHFKMVPGFGKIAKPVTQLTIDILKGTANALSKETWDRCPGRLTKKHEAHPRCNVGGTHESHYIPPEVPDGL